MSKKIKEARLHDKIYLKESRYNNPKDSFKFLIKILKKKTYSKKVYDVLDIGCANGELLYQLNRSFKNFRLFGYEIRKDLLVKAKKQNSDKVTLKCLDINKKLNFNQKFDIIICSGLLSIFNNLDKFSNNIKKLSKKNSSIFFFGNFNDYDYDVIIKYFDKNKNKNVLQTGWNIWSLKTIRNLFKYRKIKIYRFYINKRILPRKNDLIRSWTFKFKGKNHFTNGLNLIQNQMWILLN